MVAGTALPPLRIISLPWSSLFGSLFVLLTVAGLVGNAVVILAISGERKMRKSVMNMLLLNLAITDALNLITTTVEWTPTVVLGYPAWIFPAILCPIARYLECVFLFTSILTQLTVCVERYIAIVYPIHARRLCSRRNIFVTVLAIWLLVALMALPYLLSNRKRHNSRVCSNPHSGSRFWLAYKWLEFLTFYFVPCFIFVGLYSKVCVVLWANNKQLYGLPLPPSSSLAHLKGGGQSENVNGSGKLMRCPTPSTNQRELSRLDALRTRRNVVKMLVACVSVYFLCYSPIQGIFLSKGLFNINLHPPYEFVLLMNALAITCSAINPLLYTLFSKRFRARIANLLTCGVAEVYEVVVSGAGLFGRTMVDRNDSLRYSKANHSHNNTPDRTSAVQFRNGTPPKEPLTQPPIASERSKKCCTLLTTAAAATPTPTTSPSARQSC